MLLEIVLKVLVYMCGYAWLDRYDVPFWPAVGIGTVFLLGTAI